MPRQVRLKLTYAFAICGTICAMALIFMGAEGDMDVIGLTPVHLLVVSSPSAAAAGWLCAGLFGRAGREGWFVAGLGAFLSTAVGAMIGGTIVIPILGTIVAPFVLFFYFAYFPAMGLVWLLCMGAIHVFAIKARC